MFFVFSYMTILCALLVLLVTMLYIVIHVPNKNSEQSLSSQIYKLLCHTTSPPEDSIRVIAEVTAVYFKVCASASL